MARRTRKPKVVWLPTSLNERLGEIGIANEFSPLLFEQLITTIGTEVRGDQITVVTAVVKDEAQAIAGQTLSDIEGSAYRLRRIVGKIFVEVLNPNDVRDTPQDSMFWYVTCALIVLRTAANNSPMSVVLSDYNAASVNAMGDPWIWRRTWQVGAQDPGNPLALTFGLRDPNNWQPGYANLDGPHIDVKTARIVSNEERLFLVTTVTAGDGTVGGAPAQILVTGELRCLASMRTMAGNRRNASR